MENPSPEVEKAADSMSDKDAKDFASTSHKGLPDKKENMITRNRLKEIVKEVMVEEADYQTFFKKALEKAGKGINDMGDDEKKAFFNKIDAAWNGKGEKNEELTGGQHKLDVDKDGDIEGDDLADLRAGKTANESIAAELPKVSIPSAVKQRLEMAIDKIKDAKLSNVQKLQLIAQIVDALGVDKTQLGTIATKIRSKMESIKEAELPNVALPSGIEQKMIQAIQKIEAAKLNPSQKLQLLLKMVDSLGIDKSQLGAMASKIRSKMESVTEGVSSAEMDKIKGAVEAANSFMGVGAELKKLGMKYTFATEPLPIYIIQPTPNNRVAIVNKKYVSKPDFVVGDIAVGVMEGKSVKK
jgi:membrane-associated HD superfamily phosphohydrolase